MATGAGIPIPARTRVGAGPSFDFAQDGECAEPYACINSKLL